MASQNLPKYGEKDQVCLTFVLQGDNYINTWMPRRQASDIIRTWWNAREWAVNEPDTKRGRDSIRWLAVGTFASNCGYTPKLGYKNDDDVEEEATWAQCAVAWSAVIGMYLREVDPLQAEMERKAKERTLRQWEEEDRFKGDEE